MLGLKFGFDFGLNWEWVSFNLAIDRGGLGICKAGVNLQIHLDHKFVRDANLSRLELEQFDLNPCVYDRDSFFLTYPYQ